MFPKTAEPLEDTTSTRAEGTDIAETPQEAREFDEILEQAAPKLVEMARLAREAKQEGRVMRFPA